MSKQIIFVILFCLVLPSHLAAQSRCFLGTRMGWDRTQDAFLEGRYKTHDLFLVIGTAPTTHALREIGSWRYPRTYAHDLRTGARLFQEQTKAAGASLPMNGKAFADDVVHLGLDPVDEIRDLNLITPAAIVYKTVVNVVKLGWHGIKIVGEPVARMGAGSVALAGAPCVKPAYHTAVGIMYAGTAVYGYSSSAVGGAVMLGATGAVLVLDIATAPLVAGYELAYPDEDTGGDGQEEQDIPLGEEVALP